MSFLIPGLCSSPGNAEHLALGDLQASHEPRKWTGPLPRECLSLHSRILYCWCHLANQSESAFAFVYLLLLYPVVSAGSRFWLIHSCPGHYGFSLLLFVLAIAMAADC